MSNMNVSETGGMYPQKKPISSGENLKPQERVSTGSAFDPSTYTGYYDENGNPVSDTETNWFTMNERFNELREKYSGAIEEAMSQELENKNEPELSGWEKMNKRKQELNERNQALQEQQMEIFKKQRQID